MSQLARALPRPLGTGRAKLLIERNFLVYRRSWVPFVSGFLEPVFYLFAVGVGIGALVDTIDVDGRQVAYAAFVAPAMLAASAMNGAVFDATFNFFFKLKYAKVYDSVLATPVEPGDVALGEIAWALMRGFVYSVGFLVVMTVMGLVDSLWGLLALPATLLVGFAFAGAGIAATSWMRSWQDFEWVELSVLPMFLFSATFYPLSAYPPALQLVVQCTPLYQAVTLIRSLTTGAVGWQLLVPVGYLVVLGLVGLVTAARRVDVLLRR